MTSSVGRSSSSTSASVWRLRSNSWGRSPMPLVKLACGSLSTSRTDAPPLASTYPRLAAEVVLPTPPFWLAMAMVIVRRRTWSSVQPLRKRSTFCGISASPRSHRLTMDLSYLRLSERFSQSANWPCVSWRRVRISRMRAPVMLMERPLGEIGQGDALAWRQPGQDSRVDGIINSIAIR